MIEKILQSIDNITVIYETTDTLKKDDKKLFDSFTKFNDPELVGSENISNFEEILQVLARPLHFENLFWFKEVIIFLCNPLKLNSLVNMNIEHKKRVQSKLLELCVKMNDVYDVKIKEPNGWWHDEAGLIRSGLNKAKLSVESMINKYVLHIPHAGLKIPKEYIDDYFLTPKELQHNVEQYADNKSHKLYGELVEKYDSVINPYSRLFMDPERFFDDENESMQLKHALGWFYENAILEKKPLRSTKNKDKIARYYHEHHKKLLDLVEEKLEEFGECVIIDCHTFSNERYWFHDKEVELPNVCIGFDEFHKDKELVSALIKKFSDEALSINTPYAGSIVPNKFYLKDKRVKSVMIEINKKLYLEDDNVTVKNQFIPYRSYLGQLIT
ncbi:MAG: hypothetical protein GQ570_06240 [Helicobacteraceae bacterium]|nr:hypothetical protein [Helicobacteraceae bacterium]